MRKMTFTVPVWALSYLANGDKSGISLEELALCHKFYRQNRIDCFLCTLSEEGFFAWTNAFGDGQGAICMECAFSVRYTSDELFNRIVFRVDGRFGAPMGRGNNIYPALYESERTGLLVMDAKPIDWDKTPHFDRRVLLDSGAYDKGGAYWGFPGNVRVRFSKDGQYWEFYRTGDKI